MGARSSCVGTVVEHVAGWTGSLGTGASDIKDLTVERGDEVLSRELDQRDKVAACRLGEAMKEAFGLENMEDESTEGLTRRARLFVTQLQT